MAAFAACRFGHVFVTPGSVSRRPCVSLTHQVVFRVWVTFAGNMLIFAHQPAVETAIGRGTDWVWGSCSTQGVM